MRAIGEEIRKLDEDEKKRHTRVQELRRAEKLIEREIAEKRKSVNDRNKLQRQIGKLEEKITEAHNEILAGPDAEKDKILQNWKKVSLLATAK